MNSDNGNAINGIIFCIFLTLKLIGVITWSWWWVTSPLWGVLVVAALIFMVAFLR